VLAWKKSAEETWGLGGVRVVFEYSSGVKTGDGWEVHLALGLVFLLLLLRFYLACHLVLLTACCVSVAAAAAVGAWLRTVEHRAGLRLLARDSLSGGVHSVLPITRFTCANLRVFFWTPMMSSWSSR
jgi:hypothetical protein